MIASAAVARTTRVLAWKRSAIVRLRAPQRQPKRPRGVPDPGALAAQLAPAQGAARIHPADNAKLDRG
jgi:hypothetical protein